MLSYEDGLKLYERARSKKEGKTLDRRTKLRKVDEDLELLADHHRIALIHKDDTATLFFPRIYQGGFYRKWLGVYDLYHPTKKKPAVIACRHLWRAEGWRKTAVPAVNGVRFCLRTGECLNPTPWPERKQTDKAGAWRTKITKFRRTLKVMAEMGAFNHLPQEVWKKGDDSWAEKYPPLTAEELHHLVDNNEPQKVVRRLVENCVGFARLYAAQNSINMECTTLMRFDIVYRQMRDEVRKIEGCYIEEIPHEQDRAVASAA